jgi:hypothetical protein
MRQGGGLALGAVGTLGVIGGGLSAYHGYRRHGTVGAAIGWGILGAIFPVVAVPVALVQGYAQPAEPTLPAVVEQVEVVS